MSTDPVTAPVAIVTGGARGIGAAIVERLRGDGMIVLAADLDAGDVTLDVTDESQVREVFARVIEEHGRLDVLVNNAGITRDAMIHRMDVDDFRAVMDVHVQGSWLCTRAAVTHMRSRATDGVLDTGGAIVNVSSIAGKSGNLGQTNYAAAKAAIVGLTKATAREGARFGIRVNAVQPGLIRTAMTVQAMPQHAWDEKIATIPMGRAGEPSEVADVVAFLASGQSSYVTGAVIEVTGGRNM